MSSENNTNNNDLLSRIEALELEVFGTSSRPIKTLKEQSSPTNQELDFTMNIRAYVKRFVADKSGPKKFVLLLAYLTKGKIEQDVPLSEISHEWNRMNGKNMLGKFNRFYPNEAKTQGWVDSKEYGTYRLSVSWQESYE